MFIEECKDDNKLWTRYCYKFYRELDDDPSKIKYLENKPYINKFQLTFLEAMIVKASNNFDLDVPEWVDLSVLEDEFRIRPYLLGDIEFDPAFAERNIIIDNQWFN